MKTTLVYAFLLLLCSPALFAQGLKFDPVQFSKLPKAPTTDGSKSIITLPFKVDLTRNVPTILRQDKTDLTCLAFSTTVYAIGTQRAAATNSTNSSTNLQNFALSPIHAFANVSNQNCSQGLGLEVIANFLKEKGGIPYRVFDGIQCTDPRVTKFMKSKEGLTRVKEVQLVFNIDTKRDDGNLLFDIKKHLFEKRPVVVGIPFNASFRTLPRSNPYYVPKSAKLEDTGHAVTIIGYDDNKQAFKLANSYGPEWCEDGFFWMHYTDFMTHAYGGFVMQLYPEQPMDGTTTTTKTLGGKFEFKSITPTSTGLSIVSETPRHLSGGQYELNRKNWKVGQQFQLFVENTNQNERICVFSINDKNEINIHWPRDITYNEQVFGLGESDLAGPNARIVIPGSESALIIEETGTDYLCILYGLNPIKSELQSVLKKIQSSSGPMLQRVQIALGSRLAKDHVTYSPNKMEVEATPTQGDIVPIVLVIESK